MNSKNTAIYLRFFYVLFSSVFAPQNITTLKYSYRTAGDCASLASSKPVFVYAKFGILPRFDTRFVTSRIFTVQISALAKSAVLHREYGFAFSNIPTVLGAHLVNKPTDQPAARNRFFTKYPKPIMSKLTELQS